MIDAHCKYEGAPQSKKKNIKIKEVRREQWPKQKKKSKEQPVEQVLWAAADKLRKNMDAAEYNAYCSWALYSYKYISAQLL